MWPRPADVLAVTLNKTGALWAHGPLSAAQMHFTCPWSPCVPAPTSCDDFLEVLTVGMDLQKVLGQSLAREPWETR